MSPVDPAVAAIDEDVQGSESALTRQWRTAGSDESDALEPGTPIDTPSAEREPRAFGLRYGLAVFGVCFGTLPAALGGLSIKVQELVGLASAASTLGLITGVGLLSALLTEPLAGRLSDRTRSRFGMRRPWITLGAVAFVLAIIGIGFSTSIPMLAACWIIAQMGANSIQVLLLAALSDQVPEERLGKVAAIGGAAIPLGMLSAAASLSLLPTMQLRLAVPALIGGSFVLLFALTLKDRMHGSAAVGERKAVSAPGLPVGSYRDFVLAWLMKFSIMFGFGSITSFLTLILARSFAMTVPEQLKFNFMAIAISVGMMILGAAFSGWISSRFGRRKPLLLAGGLLIATGVLLVGCATMIGKSEGLTLIFIGEAVLGAGFGCFLAVDSAVAVAVAPNVATKARDLGILSVANTLPTAVAPLIGGTLLIPLGDSLAPDFGTFLWCMVAGGIAIGGASLSIFLRRVP